MSPGIEALLLFLSGGAAGAVNVAIGSGSLITFTALITAGLPPLTANVTNSVAVLPGSIVGAHSYRSDLRVGMISSYLLPSCVGAGAGAGLLLLAPADIFEAAVPSLVAFASILVIAQPAILKIRSRIEKRATQPGLAGRIGFGMTGVYGAYLGAAQGIILLALLGLWTSRLQTINAMKNVLNAATNTISASVFVCFAAVSWSAVPFIAVGATVGGHFGVRCARTLPDGALRALIVLCALVTFCNLVLR